jgi:3-deoxy-D-manno-octulosonic-acid transferase
MAAAAAIWRAGYTGLWLTLLPAVLLRLLWRSRSDPDYRRRIGERFGRYRLSPGEECIWIHAVSVGETLAALPLCRALCERFPGKPLLVTTTTPGGSRIVLERLGARVMHVYAPFDLPWTVERLIVHFRPAIGIIMETELWPCLIGACARHRVPVLIANARLSERSVRRYRRAGPLVREMLGALEAVAAQTGADAARFIALGAPPARVHVTGNLKIDRRLDEGMRERAAGLRAQWSNSGARLVWIAASTHPGEEGAVLRAFAQARESVPGLRLVMVPRHPARAPVVAQRARKAGLCARLHSAAGPIGTEVDVLVGDTLGELEVFYGAADIAFVGGSLVRDGGHNVLEPALWGVPVLSGPHLFNFQMVSERLRDAGAIEVVQDAAALAAAVRSLAADPARRAAMGDAARATVEAHRGALAAVLELVLRCCSS